MKNEIILRFCIWDFDDISVDQMTELIGVKPSKVYVKGERKNAIGSSIAEKNSWILDASLDKHSTFEEQLSNLIAIIESRIHIFKDLCNRYFCEFSCAVYIYYGNGESMPWIHLDTRYNSLMKDLNIDFDVDLYCLPNS